MGEAARKNLSIARDAARWRQLSQMLEVHAEDVDDQTKNRLVFSAFLECWTTRTMTVEEMVDAAVVGKSAERYLAPPVLIDRFTAQVVS
jgi:hypothetical protein